MKCAMRRSGWFGPGTGVARRAVLAVATACVLGFGVAGCNTIEGVGEDLSAAGKGISKGAEKTGEAIDDAVRDD